VPSNFWISSGQLSIYLANVLSTQYPVTIHPFYGSWHHFSNISLDNPLYIIPGDAITTLDYILLILIPSNDFKVYINLKSNGLIFYLNIYLIGGPIIFKYV